MPLLFSCSCAVTLLLKSSPRPCTFLIQETHESLSMLPGSYSPGTVALRFQVSCLAITQPSESLPNSGTLPVLFPSHMAPYVCPSLYPFLSLVCSSYLRVVSPNRIFCILLVSKAELVTPSSWISLGLLNRKHRQYSACQRPHNQSPQGLILTM